MTEESGKPAVIFLHGWTMEGKIFADTMHRLGSDFDCHAPDLPGHGKNESGYKLTIDGATDCIVDYLKRLDFPAVFLCGWSLGAMVAWNLVRRYPNLSPAGIAVIDMSPKIVNDSTWRLGIRGFDGRHNQRTLAAMTADWQGYALRVNAGMYSSDDGGGHPETLAIIRDKDPLAMSSLWKSLSEADERATLLRIGCPMLVIKGARSRIYPLETGRYVANAAPAAELVCMQDSGHSPHLEEPERFATVLAEWIARSMAV